MLCIKCLFYSLLGYQYKIDAFVLFPSRIYIDVTNCTYLLANHEHCFWPNHIVDNFFTNIHRNYFKNCALTGRLPADPPFPVLCSFIFIPILITLLMTALVVWRSKRSEGIV
ncbi:unnamed protein product [Staurois parvus]|uniref:Receptor activity-modifying protein 1 n=1 Tax=Staurois parvus TaxID=386267 RepID=A0ABN9ER82_9NEOB|nr:unnamed protein product [Staurois parvus]